MPSCVDCSGRYQLLSAAETVGRTVKDLAINVILEWIVKRLRVHHHFTVKSRKDEKFKFTLQIKWFNDDFVNLKEQAIFGISFCEPLDGYRPPKNVMPALFIFRTNRLTRTNMHFLKKVSTWLLNNVPSRLGRYLGHLNLSFLTLCFLRCNINVCIFIFTGV